MDDLESMVGAVLSGKWKLTRLLGSGGMGAVFAAENTQSQGNAAVKILHREYVNEPVILQRFLAEAQTAQRLKHPNIASVFEYAQAEDGSPYLVMELLQGSSLANHTNSGVPLDVHVAAPIVYGLLQALITAHQQGVVHRDIKPDNIFLVDDPNGRVIVKVLDFGIAKVMDVAGGMGSKTRTGVLLGTPGYMSPEQIKNSKAVDPRSDLWSVGVIFFELLTAKSPFDGPTDLARLTAVLTQDPTPITQIVPHLASWKGFFDKALARDPAQRFSSASEMARVLVEVARDVVLQQNPQSVNAGSASALAPSYVTASPDALSNITPDYALRTSSVSIVNSAQSPFATTYSPSALSPSTTMTSNMSRHTYEPQNPVVQIVKQPPSNRTLFWLLFAAACFMLGAVVGAVAVYLASSAL